jgi:putative hydrolase of the HAD superfamily
MAIKAVLLDIGGVLEVVDDAAWPQQWLDAWAARLGLDRAEMDARLELAGLSAVGTGVGSEQAMRRVFQQGLALGGDQLDAMFADMWDRYCGRLDTELFGYVEALIPTYRLAIISNSGDGARREEERRFGFSRLFDPIVYSHEVGVEKPDPEIYRLTLDQIGVHPAEAVFVDDVLVNVEGAQRLGITAIHHTTTEATIAQLSRLLGRGG